MQEHILLGEGETIIEVPSQAWRQQLAGARARGEERLHFMTPEHHLVRNYAVRALPGKPETPLRPEEIARAVQLPLSRVGDLLDDLEKHLFFLVRDHTGGAGGVSWAFPVTVEPTPYRLGFSTGERLFGA